jgi:hypothetical protein
MSVITAIISGRTVSEKDADGDTGAVVSGDSIKGGDVTEQRHLLLQQDNAQEFNDGNDIQTIKL